MKAKKPLIPARFQLAVWLAFGAIQGSAMAIVAYKFGLQSAEMVLAMAIGTAFGPFIRYLTTNSFDVPSLPKGTGMALLLVGVLTLSSCAWWQRNGRTILNCSVKVLEETAPALLPAAFGALTSGQSDWGAVLDKLESEKGDLALCAVRIATDEMKYRAQLAAGNVKGALEQSKPVMPAGVSRGEAWLSLRNVSFQSNTPDP